jgi:uncharacterized membrane protein YkgB
VLPGILSKTLQVAPPEALQQAGPRISKFGGIFLRYALVVVIAWIGALKYTASEAGRIQNYIGHSPLMSWMNIFLGHRELAAVLGTIELTAAVLIALRPWLPRLSAVGSAIAILLFVSTLSFLLTTPGVADPAAGGFPALGPTGQFLIKDLVLMAASMWTLGQSLSAAIRAHDDDASAVTRPAAPAPCAR